MAYHDGRRSERIAAQHTTLFAAMTSGTYALAAGCLIIFASYLPIWIIDTVECWWGFIGTLYLLTQVTPLISYNPLEERREKADILSSPLAGAVVFLVVPAVYAALFFTKGTIPSFTALYLWIKSVPVSIADLFLMLVLYRISRATVRTTTT